MNAIIDGRVPQVIDTIAVWKSNNERVICGVVDAIGDCKIVFKAEKDYYSDYVRHKYLIAEYNDERDRYEFRRGSHWAGSIIYSSIKEIKEILERENEEKRRKEAFYGISYDLLRGRVDDYGWYSRYSVIKPTLEVMKDNTCISWSFGSWCKLNVVLTASGDLEVLLGGEIEEEVTDLVKVRGVRVLRETIDFFVQNGILSRDNKVIAYSKRMKGFLTNWGFVEVDDSYYLDVKENGKERINRIMKEKKKERKKKKRKVIPKGKHKRDKVAVFFEGGRKW